MSDVSHELVLGVDYADDVEQAFQRGEVGDTPVIEAIMDHAVAAGCSVVNWRVSHLGRLTYRTEVGTRVQPHRSLRESLSAFGLVFQRIDPLRVAVDAAHARRLKLHVYFTLFDEARRGGGDAPDSEGWLGQQHPEYYLQRHDGGWSVRGVFSFGHDAVRAYFRDLIAEALTYQPDGIFLDCARSHAGSHPIPLKGGWPIWTNPYLSYGYNPPDVHRYRNTYGEDPPARTQRSDWQSLEETEIEQRWNRVRGEALTQFLQELRPLCRDADAELRVGFFPTTQNRSNPGYHVNHVLGRYHLDWPTWCEQGLVDAITLFSGNGRSGTRDWLIHSRDVFQQAQAHSVKVLPQTGINGQLDEAPLGDNRQPLRCDDDPQAYYTRITELTRDALVGGADGMYYYEHANADEDTWRAIAAGATQAAQRASHT
ncbi:MAG: hypothetical protein ACOC9P_00415 [bacterium]